MKITYLTTGVHVSDKERLEIALTVNQPIDHTHVAFVFDSNVKLAALPYNSVMSNGVWDEVKRLASHNHAVIVLVDLGKSEYKRGTVSEVYDRSYRFSGYELKMGASVKF